MILGSHRADGTNMYSQWHPPVLQGQSFECADRHVGVVSDNTLTRIWWRPDIMDVVWIPH